MPKTGPGIHTAGRHFFTLRKSRGGYFFLLKKSRGMNFFKQKKITGQLLFFAPGKSRGGHFFDIDVPGQSLFWTEILGSSPFLVLKSPFWHWNDFSSLKNHGAMTLLAWIKAGNDFFGLKDTGRALFQHRKNHGASTFFKQKNHGVGTFLNKKNPGADTSLGEKNHGRGLFWTPENPHFPALLPVNFAHSLMTLQEQNKTCVWMHWWCSFKLIVCANDLIAPGQYRGIQTAWEPIRMEIGTPALLAG